MKKLTTLLSKFKRDQRGDILVPMLIVLGLSGLVMVPLLGFMGTGLKTAQAHGQMTSSLYAAEAGVHDALWKIQDKQTTSGLPVDLGDAALDYTLSAAVNTNPVDVSISIPANRVYQVVSVAEDPQTGRETTIETYLEMIDLRWFTESALTSPSSINIQPNGTITGDVWAPDTDISKTSMVNGDIINAPVEGWPTASQVPYLCQHYRNKVSVNHTSTSINLSSVDERGNLFVSNGNPTQTFTLTGSGTLEGNIYVQGNLDLHKTCVVNLNGHTIFVEGQVTSDPDTHMRGPGALLALGDINFNPRMDSTDYVYVMSVNGEVQFQPHSNFTGSVAGSSMVDLQPGCVLTWATPPATLDLPGLDDNAIAAIRSWTIK